MNETADRGLLPRDFYEQSTATVAAELLGCLLEHSSDAGRVSGIIVETEAYLPHGDSACHAARGKTAGNASMFGQAGRAYVYTIHARQCFNVVTEPDGVGAAVLIRAVQPVSGIDLMRKRRDRGQKKPPTDRDLCRGPARLCEAFGIGRTDDGHDLCSHGGISVLARPDHFTAPGPDNRQTVRIGVTTAHQLKLRFITADSPYLSGSRRLNTP